MTEILDHALDYARRGWPVFPCDPATKAPLVRSDLDAKGEPARGTGGLYKATTDASIITGWWRRWPNAMIGVPMGLRSGVWAIDPDAPKRAGDPDGRAEWDALLARNAVKIHTHSHETPGGGLHLLFRWRPDRPVTNGEGKLKGRGINVRGEGGYVIVPPSRRADGAAYRLAEALDHFSFADAPGWLYDLILAPPERPSRSEQTDAKTSSPPRDRARYAAVALANECAAVAQAARGERNNVLNSAAFRLGTLVGAGELSEGECIGGLYDAATTSGLVADDGPRAVMATINSGLRAGLQHPRTARREQEPGPGPDARGSESSAGADHSSSGPRRIVATPYVWTDPSAIPVRDWLYGHHLIRKFVSATIAPGGVGKSSLVIAEALAMVSGKALLGTAPAGQLTVWLWNLEDPREEITRRIQATAKHYNLNPDDIGTRLFMDSGREQQLLIAETTRAGAVIVRPVVDALIADIRKNDVDVLVIDPFVSCHQVGENDNAAIDMVAKEWASVADKGNCAVELVHHTRKMMGVESEVTTESSRGGKALTDACRSVRAINRMSKDEGDSAGVEAHRLYFRTYNDKINLAPPPDRSDWFKLHGVSLENGCLGIGDNVGVVVEWTWPDPMESVSVGDLRAIQLRVKNGPWRENSQAKNWVGNAVAAVLKLDLENKAHRSRIKGMLKLWISNGMFVVVTGKDDKGNDRPFVEVGEWAAD